MVLESVGGDAVIKFAFKNVFNGWLTFGYGMGRENGGKGGKKEVCIGGCCRADVLKGNRKVRRG